MRYSAECWVLSSEFKKWRVLPLSKLSTQDSALRTALLLIIALFAGPAQAATYYVAKTGSDSNSCTQSKSQTTPKLTFLDGLGCLNAGDILNIRAGTYTESIGVTTPPSGITVQKYPGDGDVIIT